MATSKRSSLQGATELRALIRRLDAAGPRELSRGLYAEGTRIFNESQAEVPVEFGTLRSSGFVEQESTLSTVVGYAGPESAAREYALIVHENLDARHRAPTRAKFLERPALRAAAGLQQRLGARLKSALRRGR